MKRVPLPLIGKHRSRIKELDRLARRLKMLEAEAYEMDDAPGQWWGVCQKCGEGKLLQWAHIISRRIHATRWDSENALALCGGCHFSWAHHRPLEFSDWVRERLGEARYYALVQRSRNKGLDYGAMLIALQQQLKQRGGSHE